jgi:hypothetical protein
MDMESPEASKLFESFKTLKEEFEIVICSRVFWEHFFNEKSSESHAHAIMRTIFFREIVLGITRVWDNSSRNKSSLSMFRIGKYMGDKRMIDFLSEKGRKELSVLLKGIDAIEIPSSASKRASMQKNIEDIKVKAQKVNEIVGLYEGSKRDELEALKNIRDNVIAHRNIRSQPDSSDVIEIVRRIYTHTSSIIGNLIDVLGCEKWEIHKIEDLYRRQLPELKP